MSDVEHSERVPVEIGPDFRDWLIARGHDPDTLSRSRIWQLEWAYEDELEHDGDINELASEPPRSPRRPQITRKIPTPSRCQEKEEPR